MYESQKDIDAKAARLVAIGDQLQLLETAARLMGSLDERQRHERRRLLQERAYYERGHAFATWPAMLANMERIEAEGTAAEAARVARETAAAEAAAKAAAEKRATIEAQIAADNDPVTQWWRAHAARTF